MTTTYFENLKGALAAANRLLKQEDQAQRTISQGAKTSLYYAHGATVKAEIELKKQQHRSQAVGTLYTSVVRSKQNSDNLLTASKAAVTSAKGTNGKISKAAVKFQDAANALTQLSSHMASLMAITSASDQGSKMDQMVNAAYRTTQKAAQDAEQASLVSLDSTIEASQSIAADVVQKAQALNKALRDVQGKVNGQMEDINVQVTSNLQIHAEALDTENTNAGVFKAAHLETMSTENSRQYINQQTNHQLTLEDQGLPSARIQKALRPDLESLEQRHQHVKQRHSSRQARALANLEKHQEAVEKALKRTGADEKIRTEQLLMLKEFQQQELAAFRNRQQAGTERVARIQRWQLRVAEHGATGAAIKMVGREFRKAAQAVKETVITCPESVCLFLGFKITDEITFDRLKQAVWNNPWQLLDDYLLPYVKYQRAKSALALLQTEEEPGEATQYTTDPSVKDFLGEKAPAEGLLDHLSQAVESHWATLVQAKDLYLEALQAMYSEQATAQQTLDNAVIDQLKEQVKTLRLDWLDLPEDRKSALVENHAQSVLSNAATARENARKQYQEAQASQLATLQQNRTNEEEVLQERQKNELSTLKGSQTRANNALEKTHKEDLKAQKDTKNPFIPRDALASYLPSSGTIDEKALKEAQVKEKNGLQAQHEQAQKDREAQHQRQLKEVEERYQAREEALKARQAEDLRNKDAELKENYTEVEADKEATALNTFFKYIPPAHTLSLLHTLTIPGLGRTLTVSFNAYKSKPQGYRLVFVEQSEVGGINWERITHLPKGNYMEIGAEEIHTPGNAPKAYQSFTRVYLTKEGQDELQRVRENNRVALAAFNQAVQRLNQSASQEPANNFAIKLGNYAQDYKGNALVRGATYQVLVFGLDDSRLSNPDTAAGQISQPSAPLYLAQSLTPTLPADSFIASVSAPPAASALHKAIRRRNSQLHQLAPGTFRAQGQEGHFFYLFLYKDMQGNLTMETLFNISRQAQERESLNPFLGGETEMLSEYRVMLMRHEEVAAYLANHHAKATNQALLEADYRYRNAQDATELAQDQLSSYRHANTVLEPDDKELIRLTQAVKSATGQKIKAEATYKETLRKTLETNQQLPSHFTFDRAILKAEPSSNWLAAQPVNQQLKVKELDARWKTVEEEAQNRILQLRSQSIAYEEAQQALEDAERALNNYYLSAILVGDAAEQASKADKADKATQPQAKAEATSEADSADGAAGTAANAGAKAATSADGNSSTANTSGDGTAQDQATNAAQEDDEDDFIDLDDEMGEEADAEATAAVADDTNQLGQLVADVQNARFQLNNAKTSYQTACKTFNMALSDYVSLYFELNIVRACNSSYNRKHFQVYRARAEFSSAVTNFGEPVADSPGYFHAVQLTELKAQYAARSAQYKGAVSGFSNMASVLAMPNADTLAQAGNLDSFTLEGFRSQYLPPLEELLLTDTDISDDFDPAP